METNHFSVKLSSLFSNDELIFIKDCLENEKEHNNLKKFLTNEEMSKRLNDKNIYPMYLYYYLIDFITFKK